MLFLPDAIAALLLAMRFALSTVLGSVGAVALYGLLVRGHLDALPWATLLITMAQCVSLIGRRPAR